MADGCVATAFEWRKSTKTESDRRDTFHFVKEGYLHVSVKEDNSANGSVLRRRLRLKDVTEYFKTVRKDTI